MRWGASLSLLSSSRQVTIDDEVLIDWTGKELNPIHGLVEAVAIGAASIGLMRDTMTRLASLTLAKFCVRVWSGKVDI